MNSQTSRESSDKDLIAENDFALTVKYQGLLQMPSVPLSHLMGLTRLNLSHNCIESVAVDSNKDISVGLVNQMFKQLPHLVVLDMSYNYIRRLPKDSLAYNKKLRVRYTHQAVDFSYNCLREASSLLAFASHGNLACVDVSGNQMADLTIEALGSCLSSSSHSLEWLKVLQHPAASAPPSTAKDALLFKKIFPRLKVMDLEEMAKEPEPVMMTPKKKEKPTVVTPSTLSTSVKRLSGRLAVTRHSVSLNTNQPLFFERSSMALPSKGKAAKKLQHFLQPRYDPDDRRRLPQKSLTTSVAGSFFRPAGLVSKQRSQLETSKQLSTSTSIIVQPSEKLKLKRDEMRRRKLSCQPSLDSLLKAN